MVMTDSQPRSIFVTAAAAILAGLLIFAGQAGELVFGSSSDLVTVVYVLLVGGGVAALGVALWGLRTLAGSTRHGRVGVWLALAGVALLGLFIIQVVIEVIRTRDLPQNFILFALGFLLLLVGHLLFARDLRPYLGMAWLIPIIAAAGAVVALTIEADPYHDIGLFIFEAAWVALGVILIRRRPGSAATQANEVGPGVPP
jgi:hypothetical protein